MTTLRAIVAAAGEGRRFGHGTPKQLVVIAGRPVVEWSVERMLDLADEVIVAVPGSLLGSFEGRFSGRPEIRCVTGGASRWESVRRAFEATTGDDDDLVAIHDAARPALTAEDFARVVECAAVHGAAVLGRPVSDTLKRVHDGRIEATVDRRPLFAAETPQVFRRDLLRRAFRLAQRSTQEISPAPTDESALVEALDAVEVVAVAAAQPNPKLTAPGDLLLLEALLHHGPKAAATCS